MISPISSEEKQKLLEIVELNEIANILNQITKFSFYEFSNQNKNFAINLFIFYKSS